MTTMTTTKQQQLAYRKAVRARGLTDPLGVMGFRTHRERVRKETRIRRTIFAMTTLGFAGILGILIAATPEQPTTATVTGQIAVAADRPGQNPRVVSNTTQPVQQRPTHTRTRGS